MRTYVYEKQTLFEPEILLPSQIDHGRTLTKCQLLLEAIIKDALHVLTLPQPSTARKSCEWFCSESTDLFSFLFCCDHLHLNPKSFREHAKKTFAARIHFIRPKNHPEMVAYTNVYFDRTRRTFEPAWVAKVQVRSGDDYRKTLVTINLRQWGRTREEARRIAQEYINSGAWKERVELRKAA